LQNTDSYVIFSTPKSGATVKVANIMSITKDLVQESSLAKVKDIGRGQGFQFDWKRIFFILLGIGLFLGVYYSPPWDAAIDPLGVSFELSKQAKGALAVFCLAAVWWVFEVVPIGVTSLAIGTLQALFLIRDPKVAFKDFMDPSVLFIFGSLVIGMVFTKSGLTKRLAYKMLSIIGERTSMIYLGCFVMTALLTHFMAHTAVAATMFPLLMTIHALYSEEDGPTRFGKGLFIGMAFVAGAGSIITLLGSARAAVALGFYKDIMHVDISFFELSMYMFPIGWLMVFLLWGFFMLVCKPEKNRILGLKERAKTMYTELGGWTKNEILVVLIVLSVILIIALKNFVPALSELDKTGLLLHLFLSPQYPHSQRSGRYPLEYYSPFFGSDVHRLLPLGYRCRQMAGGKLAGAVSRFFRYRLYPRNGFFRNDHDQLHYERRGDSDLPAGCPGGRTLPRCFRRSHSVLLSDNCRNAISPAGWCGAKCHCL
jgi:hypothetical protein